MKQQKQGCCEGGDDSIEFACAENTGWPAGKDIPERTAAHGGDDAKKKAGKEAKAVTKGTGGSSHGKQAKSCGVYNHHESKNAGTDDATEQEGKNCSEDREFEIDGSLQGKWRTVADEDIARDATAYAGDKTEADDASEVVFIVAVASRNKCAAKGAENERAVFDGAKERLRYLRAVRDGNRNVGQGDGLHSRIL